MVTQETSAMLLKAKETIIEWDGQRGQSFILNKGEIGDCSSELGASLVNALRATAADEQSPSPIDKGEEGRPGGSTATGRETDIATLRADYEKLIGKRAFPGWDAATLRKKMAAYNAEITSDQTSDAPPTGSRK